MDYLGHIETAAADACSFIRGMSKDEFVGDKCSQGAMFMCLVVIAEAATNVMGRRAAVMLRRPRGAVAKRARHA